MTDTTTPATTQIVTPYLCVHDATGALAWYTEAFGAIETNRYTEDNGRIGHAEFVIGGARFFLSDEYPEIGVLSAQTLGGSAVSLHLALTDVDYTYQRAIANGATGERAPADQPYGDRAATIRDPYNHRWFLSQPITNPQPAHAQPADAQPAEPEVSGSTFTITGRRPVDLGYVTIKVEDEEKANRFFGDLFDWEIRDGTTINTRLAMGLSATFPAALYFRVDDIDTYAARVVALGGRVVEVNDWPSGGDAECVDDQGTTFHLFRPAPGY